MAGGSWTMKQNSRYSVSPPATPNISVQFTIAGNPSRCVSDKLPIFHFTIRSGRSIQRQGLKETAGGARGDSGRGKARAGLGRGRNGANTGDIHRDEVCCDPSLVKGLVYV